MNFRALLIMLSAAMLIACGGSGGGSSGNTDSTSGIISQSSSAQQASSAQQTSSQAEINNADYLPDDELLFTPATESADLYVEESFAFDSVSYHKLQLSVKNVNGEPSVDSRISVFSMPEGVENLSDDLAQGGELLLVGTTNSYGDFYREFEVPSGVKKIRISVDVVGIDSQALLDLDQEYIRYDFQ